MARSRKKSVPHSDDRSGVSFSAELDKASETKIKLSDLPIGARLLVRSRRDWRVAAISRTVEEVTVLTVCSPSGYSYRLRRDSSTGVIIEGNFAILPADYQNTWREN